MGNVFSVPIFIITLRETIEAAIIVSVLLGLVESLVHDKAADAEKDAVDRLGEDEKKKIIKRMRLQIWAGAIIGLFIALCIGAAFIAVFFTTLNDIWGKTEEIWEGTFSLIAWYVSPVYRSEEHKEVLTVVSYRCSVIIFVMGVTMLRIDRSKLKWKAKLAGAFDNKVDASALTAKDKRQARNSKWTLFLLPFITVLREGLEAVVFVGGVSLGQSAKSIPLAAICGILVGFVIGYLIYISGSRVNLSIFLVVSTNVLFLLGAGLMSKAVFFFQTYRYVHAVGGDVAETGSGPGSFDPTDGLVWHLTYGNPENNLSGEGWSIFNSILGWTNNATIGSVLAYCFYWIACIATLIYMKWSEGRTTLLGFKSAAWHRRAARRAALAETGSASGYETKTPSLEGPSKKDEVETPIEEDRQFASHI
ncbi:hypothetical protein JCM3774_001172 [Rhodotorula dairenensis]